MNRRHRSSFNPIPILSLPVLALVLAWLAVSAAPALAQNGAAGAAADIPKEVKQLQDATAHKTTIEGFVKAQIKLLTSDNPDDQSAARDALISGALINGQRTAAPGYLNTYADIVN